MIDVDGLGPFEIAQWFTGLSRDQQHATINDIMTVLNGRRPTRAVRWTWAEEADDPARVALTNPATIGVEEVGRVEVPREFLSMSSDDQRRIMIGIWNESRGLPSLTTPIPWRFAR